MKLAIEDSIWISFSQKNFMAMKTIIIVIKIIIITYKNINHYSKIHNNSNKKIIVINNLLCYNHNNILLNLIMPKITIIAIKF